MAGDPWDTSFCDLSKASRELDELTRELISMSDSVASARTIKEMHSERIKGLLAKGVVRSGIDSMNKAEHAARVDPLYVEGVKRVEEDLLTAEKALCRYMALSARLEGLRTLISAQKQLTQL